MNPAEWADVPVVSLQPFHAAGRLWPVDPVEHRIARLLAPEKARLWGVLPFGRSREALYVAAGAPPSAEALAALAALGPTLRLHRADAADLRQAQDRVYGSPAPVTEDAPAPAARNPFSLPRSAAEGEGGGIERAGLVAARDRHFTEGDRPDLATPGQGSVAEAAARRDAELTYRMQAVGFLNARHWVQIGGDRGEAHGHTWKVHLEADVPGLLTGQAAPPEDHAFRLPFHDLETILQSVLTDLEGRILNDLPEFAVLQPSTENLARLLLSRCARALAARGATLHSLALWESPTKGITLMIQDQGAPSPPLPAFPPEAGRGTPGFGAGAPPPRGGGPSLRSASSPSNEHGQLSPGSVGPDPLAARRDAGRGPADGRTVGGGTCPGPDASAPPRGPGAAQATARPPRSSPRAARLLEHRDHRGGLADPSPGGSQPVRADGAPREPPVASLPTRSFSGPALWYWFLASILILAASAAVYLPLILAPAAHRYPAGDDAWGHVEKALLLLRGIRAGHWLPAYDPNWYGGYPPFRYWGPAGYYLLAAAIWLLHDPFRGVSLYLAVCAGVGGLSWLAYVRRIGALAALAAGLLWVVWPGNTYVAFGTGDLPQCLATALMPLMGWAVLDLLDGPGAGPVLALALLMAAVVLVHPGEAAIAAVGFGVFALIAFGLNATGVRGVGRVCAAVVCGIGASAWWLLPALVGGPLRQANPAQAAGGFTPLWDMLNPWLHARIPDMFYWGGSTLVVVALGIATWSGKSPWARAALVSIGVFVAGNMPVFSGLYNSLPLRGVLPPDRFIGVGGVLLFAGGLLLVADRVPFPVRRRAAGRRGLPAALWVVVAAAAVVMDAWVVWPTVRTVSLPPPPLLAGVRAVASRGGWREATLDLSQLGSFPTEALAAAGKPQVFGWAIQGAGDLHVLVDVNTALQNHWYPYLFDRLRLLGATQLLGARRFTASATFAAAARDAGFQRVLQNRVVTAWTLGATGPSGPYAVAGGTVGLVIGRYASVWTSLFPQLGSAPGIYLDGYTAAQLRRFPILVLSGFRWRSARAADALLRSYVGSGGHLVVDLTGAPIGVFSRRPRVLGVYGEPVDISGGMTLEVGGRQLRVGPFPPPYNPWQTYVPQGLDHAMARLDALGMSVPLVGYRTLSEGRVWFLGGNLPFLGYLTRDQRAIGLVARTVGLRPGARPVRRYLPLQGMRTSSAGVRFQLVVPPGTPMPVVLPFSLSPGERLQVGQQAVHPLLIDGLPNLYLAPGRYAVALSMGAPAGAGTGEVASGLAVLALFAWLAGMRTWRRVPRLPPWAAGGRAADVA